MLAKMQYFPLCVFKETILLNIDVNYVVHYLRYVRI